jgi:phosphoribosylpyrophosphate synthetase
MDKKKYIIIAACRSAADYANDVYLALREDPRIEPSLLRLVVENIDFADSKVRPKIVQAHRATSGHKKELSDALLNSNLLLFQNMHNPLAKEPDVHSAEEIIRFMDQFEIPADAREARIVIREQKLDERLNECLMNLAATEQHESGEWRGFLKSYFMEPGKRRLKRPYLARLIKLFRERHTCPPGFFKYALRSHIRDVIQPRYTSTEFIEFFSTVFNARRRGARRITAVWPFSDGRSDRFSRGELNETEYLAHTARNAGIQNLITVRMHSKDKQEDIWKHYGIGVHNISAISDLAEKVVERYGDLIKQRKLVLTTIDLGGEEGTIALTEEVRRIAYKRGLIENPIDVPYTIMDKDREAAHKVKKIVIQSGYGKDDPSKLQGMVLLPYDDMVDTSGSLVTYTNDVAVQYKVEGVVVMVEHPVLSYPAVRNLRRLHKSGILKDFVTYDTIPHPEYDFHTVLDSKPLVIAKIKEMFFPQNGVELPKNPDW